MQQPTSSRAEIERRPDGLTIRLPAAGLRAAKPELRFALAFTGILGFITAVFLLILVGEELPALGRAVFVTVAGLLWAIPVGLLTQCWRRSRQRIILDVVDQALLITSAMPMRRRQLALEGGNIRAIDVGPSDVEVDGEPVLALVIELRNPVEVEAGRRRRKLKLFREREAEELRWVAWELRQALGLGQAAVA